MLIAMGPQTKTEARRIASVETRRKYGGRVSPWGFENARRPTGLLPTRYDVPRQSRKNTTRDEGLNRADDLLGSVTRQTQETGPCRGSQRPVFQPLFEPTES